jgi:adenylate cyclase
MRGLLIRIRQSLGSAKIARRLYRRLPSAKRCKECLVPFLGLFSVPFSLVQIRPSRKNPNLCTL